MIAQYKLDTRKASNAKITYPRLNPTFYTLKPQLAITSQVIHNLPVVKKVVIRNNYPETQLPVRFFQVVTMAMLVTQLLLLAS